MQTSDAVMQGLLFEDLCLKGQVHATSKAANLSRLPASVLIEEDCNSQQGPRSAAFDVLHVFDFSDKTPQKAILCSKIPSKFSHRRQEGIEIFKPTKQHPDCIGSLHVSRDDKECRLIALEKRMYR